MGLEDLEVGRRVETIQTTALLRTARILRRVLETWGDLLILKLQWKNHQFTLMWKTPMEVIIIIIIIEKATGWGSWSTGNCKQFKFDHTNKCYMYIQVSVREKVTLKVLWNFEMQTDRLISARRPDLVIVQKRRKGNKKRTCWIDLAPVEHRVKLKEKEKKDEYLDIARDL